MAAVAQRSVSVKPRKKPKRDNHPKLGNETFRVRDIDGAEVIPPQVSAGVALSKAQNLAVRTSEQYTYFIERQTLFGDPVDLYRVERTEGGSVFTYTLSRED